MPIGYCGSGDVLRVVSLLHASVTDGHGQDPLPRLDIFETDGENLSIVKGIKSQPFVLKSCYEIIILNDNN